VAALISTEPADVPFIAALVAIAVELDAHFDPVDVCASAAGFQFHWAAPSKKLGAGCGLRLGSSNRRGCFQASSMRLQAMSK
jgi:hypothetical protein